MSATWARALAAMVRGLTRPLKPWRRRTTQALVSEYLALDLDAPTKLGPLKFHCPTRESLHFVREFSFREPDTLAWIESFQPGDVLWDIGANVGQYALYAALRPGVRVLAFEPGAASFAALMRNIEMNDMSDRIAAYCLAFDARTALDTLNMARTDAGSSMHAVGTDEDAFGRRIAVRFRQAIPVCTVDRFVATFGPSLPTHLKIDVDSIEDRIVAGAAETLRSPELKSVMIELEGDRGTPRNRAIVAAIEAAGLAAAAAGTPSANVLFRRP
ncbi:MAG: FkbM family methyltransferase [Rhodospirillales bacterium]|nr:FkbM family methyltransferase [Rhodospirillales bacterium]